MRVLALADDLTGALEVGAKFAACGLPAIVVHGSNPQPDAEVLVINTESRHLSPEQAERAISGAADSHAPLIYKKTDSTLRGNIRAELRALSRMHPQSRIAYFPAYPAMGRTVRDGHLYVNGVPVHQTSFARDPLNPVTESSVAAVVGDEFPCTIFDGETTADVVQSAAQILQDRRYSILAGPAALAEALAGLMSGGVRKPIPWPSIRTCLIVNGSLHERSAQQIDHALRCGRASETAGLDWQVFKSTPREDAAPLDIARDTGAQVRDLMSAGNFDALLIFGGDTAMATLEALGCSHLRPIGEVLEGVPLSQVIGRNLYLLTKAGGFGDIDVICRLREILDGTKAT